PSTPQGTHQELRLLTILGPALIASKGYAAPEVERVYLRAHELCQQRGDTSQLFPILFGLCIFYFIRGELQTARELAEQLLTLAQSVDDPALLLEASLALGNTLFFLGELRLARKYEEQSIALYDPQQHHAQAFLYGGTDPGVICFSYTAWVLWHLGYPDQAIQ